MSFLVTVGQVNALLQTARGVVDAVRGATTSTATQAPQRSFAEILDEASTQLITTCDRDGNGVLEANELPLSSETFARMDVNGDGALGKDELVQGYKAFMQDRYVEQLLTRFDVDGDRQLTATELGVTGEQLARLDTNGDATVGREELLSVFTGTGEQA